MTIMMKKTSRNTILLLIPLMGACLPLSISETTSLQVISCSPMKDGFVDCSHRGLTEVPKNIPKSVKVLDLSHNKLHYIPSDSFDGLTYLQKLYLDHNSISRKSIVMDLFKDLKKLQELYLNHNEVNKFQENVFTYLAKLRILDLSDMNNGVPKQIPAAVFEPLKSLIDLRMNNVLLSSFNFLSDGTLSKLRNLELARNKVKKIAKDDFGYLKGTSIDNLDLSLNTLSNIDPSCFKDIKLLKFLNLEHSLQNQSVISQVGAAIKNVHITNITLARIGLSELDENTFKSFDGTALKGLDLSLNNISKIDDGPFIYLKELEELNLYKNNISVIGPNAFHQLSNLRSLDLANNSLSTLNQTTFQSLNGSVLETMYLELNFIETIEPGAFQTLGQMKYLKLSKNRIDQTIDGSEFDGMPALEYLDLGLNKEIDLGDDAFESIPALKKLYLNVIGLKKMTAGKSPFRHLSALQTLDLSNNSLSLIVAPDIFKSLTKMQVVYLQHNNLYHLWEDPPHPMQFLEGLKNLQKVDLSYNGFHFIPDGIFKSLTHLQTLLLAHNKIANLSSSSFDGLTSLSNLELHYNSLNVIDESSLHPFIASLRSLSISQNKWLCNCDLEWFRKWINNTNVIIPDLGKTFCADPPGELILDFWPSPYDCDGILRPMYYYIIGGVTGFLIGIFVTLWCCRWRIRYCLLRGRARKRYRKKDGYSILPGRNSNYESDVFISYSSKDGTWVKDVLTPQLTSAEDDHEHFQVIDHDESFIAGESIIENITAAVDRSRKTLCILSRNYLKSEWCRFEHDVAMFKHIGDKKCLIVIRLDGVTDQELKQHDRINQVLRQDTYLVWPGDDSGNVKKNVFWERLREAIAKIEDKRCGCCCC